VKTPPMRPQPPDPLTFDQTQKVPFNPLYQPPLLPPLLSTLVTIQQVLLNPRYEIISGIMVLLSCASFAFLTIPTLTLFESSLFTNVEDFASIFFLVEYTLRMYSSRDPRDMLEPLNVIDLMSFLPTILLILFPSSASLFSNGGLSFLRLLRILRLQRFVADFETFKELELSLGLPPESVKMSQLKFARVFSSLATLLFISTGLIYTFEHSSNPNIPDFFTALYFGLCTLTTVGFGDIVPVTPAGRAVVCASIVAGIGVVPLQVGELAESLLGGEKTQEVRGVGGEGGEGERDIYQGNVTNRKRFFYCTLALTTD
jgi:voltage-gated potassium channel